MRRRTEFLVSKRDGRREWLRATKLARSIAAALDAVGHDGDVHGLGLELASVVLAALRQRRRVTPFAGDEETCLSTAELASAVERTLWVSGRPEAAVRFAAFRSERLRRVAACVGDRRPSSAATPALHARVAHHHN